MFSQDNFVVECVALIPASIVKQFYNNSPSESLE